MCGVHHIYNFAAFCLPWPARYFCLRCRCYRSCYRWSWPSIPASWSCSATPSHQGTSERARNLKITGGPRYV